MDARLTPTVPALLIEKLENDTPVTFDRWLARLRHLRALERMENAGVGIVAVLATIAAIALATATGIGAMLLIAIVGACCVMFRFRSGVRERRMIVAAIERWFGLDLQAAAFLAMASIYSVCARRSSGVSVRDVVSAFHAVREVANSPTLGLPSHTFDALERLLIAASNERVAVAEADALRAQVEALELRERAASAVRGLGDAPLAERLDSANDETRRLLYAGESGAPSIPGAQTARSPAGPGDVEVPASTVGVGDRARWAPFAQGSRLSEEVLALFESTPFVLPDDARAESLQREMLAGQQSAIDGRATHSPAAARVLEAVRRERR